MIRSVSHTPTKAWHRAHRKRARRSWAIVIVLVLALAAFAGFGYFAHVPWMTLSVALAQSTYRVAAAYVIALLLGVSIALVVGWSPLAEFFFPVFDVLQNVPSFALIPLFIYSLGTGDEMIILFSVSSALWPILFAVLTAVRGAPTDLNDAATIFGAKGLRRIGSYLAPLSFPAMITGSIVGIAICWETVIGSEIIVNSTGFGAFIRSAGASGLNANTVAGTMGILILIFIINRLIWSPLLADSAKHYAE